MSQAAVHVGIDCGKSRLDAALFPAVAHRQVANTPEGHQELAIWIKERGAVRVGLEASGGYERPVRDALVAVGLEVHVLDPARVRYFAKAKGQWAKTDAIDARVIAEFTACMAGGPSVVPDRAREELAGLVRTRRALVDKRADLRKVATAAPEAAREAVDAAIEALSRSIAELDDTLTRQVHSSPIIKQTVERLVTAPGIGPVVAVSLAALAPELGRLTGGQMAALAGVAPFADDSGERSGRRRIAGGRADLRRVLYMAAMVAATHTKGIVAAFYQRLIKAGKPPKLAITACMRKLLTRLNAMLAHAQTWNEQAGLNA